MNALLVFQPPSFKVDGGGDNKNWAERRSPLSKPSFSQLSTLVIL